MPSEDKVEFVKFLLTENFVCHDTGAYSLSDEKVIFKFSRSISLI